MRQEQVLRQWKILVKLDQTRNGLSPSELAAELDSNVRTVYRDLATLQEVGFPFTSEKNDGITRYCLARYPGIIGTLNFGPSELLALYLSQGFLSQLRGTIFQEAIDQLLNKVSLIVPSQAREHFKEIEAGVIIEFFTRRDYKKKGRQISAILSCLRDKKVLAMNYFSPNRGELAREVDPYHLWVMGDSLYLIGFCHLNQEIRTFLVDRINSATPTRKPFSLIAGFDFRKFSSESFRVMRSGPVMEYEFRFKPEVAHLIRERIWHSSQKIRTNPDRSVTLTFNSRGMEEIKSWVLSFGDTCQVIKPDQLRKEIKEECRNMIKKYGG